MAWRDSRSSRRKLFVYMSAIIIGVAAQVAISSFRDNLNYTINNQSKELLGADLLIRKNAPFQEELQSLVDSLGGDQSTTIEFNSMAFFPRSQTARLSQITALEGAFPYYGALETVPITASNDFQESNSALVDEPIMLQFDIEVGDSVKIGNVTYHIAGALQKVPGEAGAAGILGPRIYIPKRTVQNTGLLARGSLAQYNTFIKLNEEAAVDEIEETLEARRDILGFSYDTVEERQENIGEAISGLARFLNLIGFIALLLGGLGVASSIYVYIRQKISTVAVLRCFGASSQQTLWIYLIQAASMGLLGAALGALLGSLVQLFLPVLVQDFLPLDIELFVSWPSVFTGIFTGTGISIVFALFPLLAVRNVSPLFTLRSVQIQLNDLLHRGTRILMYLLIFGTMTGYAWLITSELMIALGFTVGLTICMLILALISRLIIKGARRFFPSSWSYVWRQGFANLYRPNNQTAVLILTFGLGITLISSLYLTQDLLLSRIDFQSNAENPNLILYDIQTDQNDGLNQIIAETDTRILQNTPIVAMKLGSLKGRPIADILADTGRVERRWTLNRDYRVTYRDSLIDSEELVQGSWIGNYDNTDPDALVPISISEGILDDLNVALGDTIVWDVQGIPITSYIASTRDIDFNRPQPNFLVLFPTGILEPAPQFFATVLKVRDRDTSINLQRQIVQAYPNVSAIDISLTLETIQGLVDKITFVIQFMGFFSIITGLIVLASSVTTSRFQRVKESVLLRTLGAKKPQIMKIQSIEYFLLGMMAAITGLSLSIGTTWILTVFYFEIEFVANWTIILTEIVGLVSLVMIVGLSNMGDTLKKPPLEVLRLEAT